MSWSLAPRFTLVVVLALSPSSCGSSKDTPDEKTVPLPGGSVAATTSAAVTSGNPPISTATASAPEKPRGKGPMVTVPAGAVAMGHACGAVPRVTDEELAGTMVSLGEFAIDVYPYPNDPTQPLKTNVSRAEAERLCKADSKRLCSEVEWERACKGASNATFEYGSSYDKNACAKTTEAGKRDRCQSTFGVRDMHGLAWEWTASPWGRGQQTLATVRGYGGPPNVVRERCASGQGREPSGGFADVGFRCCSGTDNAASVDLPITHDAVLVEDKPRPDVIASLLKAMPADHQKIDGATVSFDRVWRWHPRDNEELILARWVARNAKGGPRALELAVFKACGAAVVRVERMRGPVEKLDTIRETTSKEKLAIDVATKKDKGSVDLTYWYGAVAFKEPVWIRPGNSLPQEPDKKKDATKSKKPPLVKVPMKPRPNHK